MAMRESCNSNPVIPLMACPPFTREGPSLPHQPGNNRPSCSPGKLRRKAEDEPGVGALSSLAKLGSLGQVSAGKRGEM